MRFEEYRLENAHGGVSIRSYHSTVEPQTRPYRAHHHTECEISLFIEGEGVYTVGDKVYPYAAGDVFLFGSNEAHSVTEIGTHTHILNIHFEPRLLWEHPENRGLLALFTARRETYTHRFARDGILKALLLEAEKELKEKRPCYALAAQNALLSALLHLIRAYDLTREEEEPLTAATTRGLKDAVDFIEANIENKLTLADIAARAHMAPTYFSAMFKRYNGISPWDYIIIKRVERAIEMLRSTDMTKLEIAERCGFSGSSNFYKAFFKVTGKRPGDYAKAER